MEDIKQAQCHHMEKETMKLYPHESGREGQSVTYAMVKDHIVSYIQRSYRYGKDIAVSLRD